MNAPSGWNARHHQSPQQRMNFNAEAMPPDTYEVARRQPPNIFSNFCSSFQFQYFPLHINIFKTDPPAEFVKKNSLRKIIVIYREFENIGVQMTTLT